MHGVMGADARLPRDHVTSIALGELEKSIGLRLLHRTTRRIELADAGQAKWRATRVAQKSRLGFLRNTLRTTPGSLFPLVDDPGDCVECLKMAESGHRYPFARACALDPRASV